MKILAIGNSFSQDAFKYLNNVSVAGGHDVTTVNLYIGGCTLEHHWNNVLENKDEYQYQLNGLGEGSAATTNDTTSANSFITTRFFQLELSTVVTNSNIL